SVARIRNARRLPDQRTDPARRVDQSAAKRHANIGRKTAARKTATPGRGRSRGPASSRRSRRRTGVVRAGLAVFRFVGQALRLPPAFCHAERWPRRSEAKAKSRNILKQFEPPG